jgi:hypothetical protein
MPDVMEERVRSIQLGAGLAFALGALVLSLSLVCYPSLPPANQTNVILERLAKEDVASWMWLHAFMAAGFLLAGTAFTAFGFLLHLRGSSGPASVVTVGAIVGAALWTVFLSAEFFVAPFFKNLYPIDPGLATMLFTTVWFWKMGALLIGGVLMFVSVIFAGLAATWRKVLPVWLGWGGVFFGVVGVLVYVLEFWNSTATGAAVNPMRNSAVRFGVGLPLQVWMLAVGATLLREYRDRVTTLPPQARTPVPRREPAARAPEPPPLPPPIP